MNRDPTADKLAPLMLLIAAATTGLILKYWSESSISVVSAAIGVLITAALCIAAVTWWR